MKNINDLLGKEMFIHAAKQRINHTIIQDYYIPVYIKNIELLQTTYNMNQTVLSIRVETISSREEIKRDRKRTGISIGLLDGITKNEYTPIFLEDDNKEKFLKNYKCKYYGGYSDSRNFYFSFRYTFKDENIFMKNIFDSSKKIREEDKISRFELMEI